MTTQETRVAGLTCALNLRRACDALGSVTVLLLICASIANAQSGEATRIRIPGTRVSFVPPDEYTPASAFPGYQNLGTGSAIMVTEFDQPFSEASAAFGNAVVLRMQGMKLLEKIDPIPGDREGLLVKVQQEAYGQEYEKWIYVFGNDERSVVTIATCPVSVAAHCMPTTHDSLLTARVETSIDTIDPYDGLSYRITDHGGMKPLTAVRAANQIAFSPNGEIDAERTGRAFYAFGPAIGPAPSASRPDSAASALQSLAMYKDVNIVSTQAVMIDGLEGIETIATATNRASEGPTTIVQTMLFDGVSYWRGVGAAPESERAEWLPILRRMARSFERDRTSYTDDNHQFRVTAPGGWSALYLVDGTDLQIGHPTAECYLIAQIMPINPDEATLEDVTSEQLALVLDNSIDTIESSVAKTLGGHPALETIVHTKSDKIRSALVVVQGERNYYYLDGWMVDWAFDADRRCVDEVIATFEEISDE